MRQENLPSSIPIRVKWNLFFLLCMYADASSYSFPWGYSQAWDAVKLGADGAFTLNSAIPSAHSAVHAVVYNEGDFACCLPCLQAAGEVSARGGLVQCLLSCLFFFSECVHRAPPLCAFPTGTATAPRLPKGSSRRGVTDLSCPVLCSPKTRIMASIIGTCLLFVSL